MASGSSRVLWKPTNSQNRKTSINEWNGTTTLNPVKVFKLIKPDFAVFSDAQVIDTVKLTRPVDPSINQKAWNAMRKLPVTVDYMYQVLRFPLCTVAADKETKERLRKIAFAMRTRGPNGENVPRTQRDRLVRLLTRLTGGKHSNRTAASRRESTSCGFDPAITYRLITDAEMTQLGFKSAVGEAGKYKFFYKATRHGLWSKNDKKYRIREYLAPSPKAGRNGLMPASKPLRVPQRIVQRGLKANGRNANAPWHRDPGQKWSGTTSGSGVWRGRPATPAPSPRRPANTNTPRPGPFISPPVSGLNAGPSQPISPFPPSNPSNPSEMTNAQINWISRHSSLFNPQNAPRPANQVPQSAQLPNFTNAELRIMEAVGQPRQSATPPVRTPPDNSGGTIGRLQISSGNMPSMSALLRAKSPGLFPSGSGRVGNARARNIPNADLANMLEYLDPGPRQPTPTNSGGTTKTMSGRATKNSNSGRTTNTSRARRSRTPARKSTPARQSANANATYQNFFAKMYEKRRPTK